MQPQLFNKNDYGVLTWLGTLTSCTSCVVKEARNGEYNLNLSTTVNDECAEMILSQRYILAKPNPTDNAQYFRIQKTERYIDGKIKVEAKHISTDVFSNCSEGDSNTEGIINTVTGTPKEVWDTIMTDYVTVDVSGYSFSSDIETSKSFSLGISTPETLGNILCGKEGSFVDTWGGELKYNNSSIQLLKSRGKTSDYIIKYGQNISEATQTESVEGTYSHVLPYGKVSNGNHKINFYAPAVKIDNTDCKTTRVFLLDCNEFLEQYTVGEKGENYSTVKAAMTSYAKTYAENNDLGKCAVSIEVDLRAELDEMSQLGLCDTVKVILDNYNTIATAKISEVEYDALSERWNKIVVGTPSVNFADLILNKRRYLP